MRGYARLDDTKNGPARSSRTPVRYFSPLLHNPCAAVDDQRMSDNRCRRVAAEELSGKRNLFRSDQAPHRRTRNGIGEALLLVGKRIPGMRGDAPGREDVYAVAVC